MGYPYQPGGSGGGGSSVYAPNTLSGFTLSNNVSTPNTVLNIGVNPGGAAQGGACVDSTNTANINLAAAITKTIASTFTSGTGNGMLDVGSVGASLTYHVYAINGASGNDITCSLCNGNSGTVTISIASPGVVTWANHGLQIGSAVVFATTGALPTGITAGTRYYVIATGYGTGSFEIATTQGGSAINTSGSQSGTHTATSNPALASGFTYFRRVGSILIDSSSHIIPFTQNGNTFNVRYLAFDVNGVSLSTTPTLYVLKLPVGIPVEAILGALTSSSNHALLITNPAITISGFADGQGFTTYSTSGIQGGECRVWTDVFARVQAVSAGTCTFYVSTNGWNDPRGTQN